MELKYKHQYNIALTRKETKEGVLNIDLEKFKKYCEGCDIESEDDIENLLNEYVWDNLNELTLPLASNEEEDDLDTDVLDIINLKDFISELSINIKISTCCEKWVKNNWTYKFCPDCGKELIR